MDALRIGNEQELLRAIEERAKVLREYAGTDISRHFVLMLELLRASYMNDLVAISQQDLPAKQGALRQVMALHQTLTGAAYADPRV